LTHARPAMPTPSYPISILLVLAASGVGCAAQPPPPEAPLTEPAPITPDEPAPAAPEPEAEPAAQLAWTDMTKDQKKEHMKSVVLPGMQAVFQELDATKYADIKCGFCHGAGVKDGSFEMPNPELPKLDPENGFAKHVKDEPQLTQFMMDRVSPEMARLLGVPPYDPETHEGFGCFNCHTMAGK
jgi:hypothetical protein